MQRRLHARHHRHGRKANQLVQQEGKICVKVYILNQSHVQAWSLNLDKHLNNSNILDTTMYIAKRFDSGKLGQIYLMNAWLTIHQNFPC